MLGKFITLEGIEGVGKSTNMRFIAQYVEEKGKTVVTTREPGGTPLAEDLRKTLLTEYQEYTWPETELLMLYAGRFQHVENVIKPALRAGKWVLSDRFNDATFAYQGAGRHIPLEKIAILDRWVLGDFHPHLTIILDGPVEMVMQRIKGNRILDRFEKEKYDFFERIRQGYLARAGRDPMRYRVISVERSLEEVQKTIRALVDDYLK